MSSTVTGLLAFLCIFAGSVVGLLLKALLPDDHKATETRDVVRLAIGMVSILTALVLGLLTASAKNSFDKADADLRAFAADLIMLDQILRNYGTDGDPVRAMLRSYTERAVHTTWPDVAPAAPQPLEDKQLGGLLDHTLLATLALAPTTDDQRWLRSQALEIASRLVRTRWALLVNQAAAISPALIGIMVLWVTVIFLSFGLFAPHNATVVTAFLICSLSIGASIFLILDMATPFEGVIRVSGASMKNALDHLSR